MKSGPRPSETWVDDGRGDPELAEEAVADLEVELALEAHVPGRVREGVGVEALGRGRGAAGAGLELLRGGEVGGRGGHGGDPRRLLGRPRDHAEVLLGAGAGDGRRRQEGEREDQPAHGRPPALPGATLNFRGTVGRRISAVDEIRLRPPPAGRTHSRPRGGHSRIWKPTGMRCPPSPPRSRAPTNGPAEAMPRLFGPGPAGRRPASVGRWRRDRGAGSDWRATVSSSERPCPALRRSPRGTVGRRISAVDEIRLRPPPEGGRIRVRGAATAGFGAERDCRTPLRLRAGALRRTARPRQCLGFSGRDSRAEARFGRAAKAGRRGRRSREAITPTRAYWKTASGLSRLSEPSKAMAFRPSAETARSIERVWAISPSTAPITSASPAALPVASIWS